VLEGRWNELGAACERLAWPDDRSRDWE
jgi:hypothetical protein